MRDLYEETTPDSRNGYAGVAEKGRGALVFENAPESPISGNALLAQLTAQVSAEEYAALKEHTNTFAISEYNRAVVLRMMEDGQSGDVKAGDVKAGDMKIGDVKTGDVKTGDRKNGAAKNVTAKNVTAENGVAKNGDGRAADGLVKALENYLARYMPENPEAHKWIILSCVYLAMAAGEPMHPQQIVGWKRVGEAYFCPAREDGRDSVCRYCVCRQRKRIQ